MATCKDANHQPLFHERVPWFIAIIFLPGALVIAYTLILKVSCRLGMQAYIFSSDVKVDGNFHPPLGWALAVLLDTLFFSLWVMHKTIYYDTAKTLFVTCGRFLFIPWKKSIPLSKISSFRIRKTTGYRRADAWDMEVILTDQEARSLVRVATQNQAIKLAAHFSEVLNKPIVWV